MIPLLALGLIACQASPTEDLVTEENNENEAVNERDSKEANQVDLALYDEVIKDYANFTKMTQDVAENAKLEYVKAGANELFYDSNSYEGISHAYYDINDDGVDELLLALRINSDFYALIDLFTIVDGKVISPFTDEISATITYKRSGLSLIEDGNIIAKAVNAQGELFGSIYELKEETMEYIETYKVTVTEGDAQVLEEALENKLDINTFDWHPIDREQDSMDYDQFGKGDFSALEGKWKPGYEKDNDDHLITIEGNTLSYENGDRVIINFIKEKSDERVSVFDLRDEDGFGALLYFYPENSEIQFDEKFVPSNVKQARFFVTQSDPPGENSIYYKVSDVNE